MNCHTTELGVWSETPSHAYQIQQRLTGPELVDRRPTHCARHLYPRAVHRDEHHVPRLEPDVAPGVASDQVVVQVEARDRPAQPSPIHVPPVPALPHPAPP